MISIRPQALITGCNRGIGAGLRDTLLAAGWSVTGLNRSPADCGLAGYRELHCDLGRPDEIGAAPMPAKLDLLVHNAAVRRFGAVTGLSKASWEESLGVNLSAAFHLSQTALPALRQAGGTCVFIGSHAEKHPFPGGAAYCATKAGLRALAECLSEEERHHGVRCVYLSIGAVQNRAHGGDESWKLQPEDLGALLLDIAGTTHRALPSYIDFRPLRPRVDGRQGIERLQYL